MAINLRFTGDNETRIAKQAEQEGLSINSVINKAIAEYITKYQRKSEVDAILDDEFGRWDELLDRLK
ncbi:hypothetical protein ACFVMC_05145 [Nocardia sp. NPDC127579]|uniref:hypothetical protein n=1 Tax=Nocardia sp. NPDC127579 TaxID=3345402 RepID=UPI00362B045F